MKKILFVFLFCSLSVSSPVWAACSDRSYTPDIAGGSVMIVLGGLSVAGTLLIGGLASFGGSEPGTSAAIFTTGGLISAGLVGGGTYLIYNGARCNRKQRKQQHFSFVGLDALGNPALGLQWQKSF